MPSDATGMSMELLYDRPGHLIRRAQQIAVSIFIEECGGLDLTPVQYAALVAVGSHPGLDATRLSALVALDRSTIGNVLERLEGKGLIVRINSPEDRRLKLLHITDAGMDVIGKAEPGVRRTQERLLAPLAPGDRERFIALLTQIVELNNDASRVPQGMPPKR